MDSRHGLHSWPRSRVACSLRWWAWGQCCHPHHAALGVKLCHRGTCWAWWWVLADVGALGTQTCFALPLLHSLSLCLLRFLLSAVMSDDVQCHPLCQHTTHKHSFNPTAHISPRACPTAAAR